MRVTILGAAALAGTLAFASAARADTRDPATDACTMQDHDGNATAAGFLLPAATATPARQAAVVWFMRPVQIGKNILQGKYIIEHDTDRQARGEPCTHLYAFNRPEVPIVAFHCRHLDRPAPERGTVTVVSTGDPTGLQKLTEFQFAGDAAAHGVPRR